MTVDQWLAFARGPLFLGTFLFMVLALLRLAVIHTIAIARTWQNTNDHNINVGEVTGWVADWLVPVRHILATRPLFSITSFVWHITLLAVPVLLIDHNLLWSRGLGLPFALPGINRHAATLLTVGMIVLTIMMILFRALNKEARFLSEPMDYIILVLLAVPFVTGFLAAHPSMNPFAYNSTMLAHVLSAELTFVLMPLTKLAHVILWPFGRISTFIYWRFPEGSGEVIAREIFGEEAKV